MARKNRDDDIPEEFIPTRNIEGKKIFDEEGKVVGKVQDIHIDPITFNIKGISITRGKFKGSRFIDSSYISSLSEEGVILLAAPIHQQYFDELY